jgi:hypothetical protein
MPKMYHAAGDGRLCVKVIVISERAVSVNTMGVRDRFGAVTASHQLNPWKTSVDVETKLAHATATSTTIIPRRSKLIYA